MRPKTYMLAKAIQERKEILFGNNTSDGAAKVQHNCKDKEEAWETVRTLMIENGFANFEKKSWRDVRNHDWQYLRRSAVAKFEHNQKSPGDPIQYSEVDKIVFDIMGNEGSSFTDYDCDRSISEFGIDGVVENLLSTSANGGSMENSTDFAQIESKVGLLSDAMNGVAKNGGKRHSKSIELDRQSLAEDRNSEELAVINQLQQNDQQQNRRQSLLFKAASGGRKRSWDTTSSGESSSTNNNTITPANLHINAVDNVDKCNGSNVLAGAISPTTLAAEYGRMLSGAQMFSNLDFLNGLNGVLERSAASPNVQSNSRKSLHTSEDDILDAKLQLILVQVKREEALLQQDQAKVLQEYAKVRQENVKAELLELELASKKKR